MKSYYFLLIIISISYIECIHKNEIIELFPVENNIIILTNENFDKALEIYQNLLVLFYSPRCIHCIKFLPVLENISKILDKQNITIAKLNTTKEIKISTRYKIVSVPTLFFF